MDKGATADGLPESDREILQEVEVRPVRPEEEARWASVVRHHHYLGLRQLVGEAVRHVAEVNGVWVAALGWSSAALKVEARDAWIGWSPEQREQRLRLVAQNARFVLLPRRRIPNLASRILALSAHRLSADWQAAWGHPVVLLETFVDPRRFEGTCYRAAGWTRLGESKGFSKSNRSYVENGQPKSLWVRPLFRLAPEWLVAPFDVPHLRTPGTGGADLNRVALEGADGLLAALTGLPDARHRRGVRHSQVSVLAVAVCAVLANFMGFRAMGDFAASLSQEVLARLGCRRCPRTGRRVPPSEATLRRTVQRVDGQRFDEVVTAFLRRLGDHGAIAVDGKCLRGAVAHGQTPPHLLAAVTHQVPVVLAQHSVDTKKENETKAFQPLLQPLDLRGRIVTADALHAHRVNTRHLIRRGGDYVVTVKGNQPQLLRSIRALPDWALSPPVQGDGEGSRSSGDAHDSTEHGAAGDAPVPEHRAGLPDRALPHGQPRPRDA